MTYDELKDVLGRNLGQRLTPELVLGILAAQRPPPLPMPAPLVIGSYSYQREFVHDALEGGAEELAKLHWDEIERHRHQLGYAPNWGQMSEWEDAGRLVAFTVRHGNRVVGYMAFHLADGYHTNKRIATEDGLFLVPEHRRGLTAVRLIRYAEHALKALGVGEVHVITKAGTTADQLMDKIGYPAVSNLRIKVLGD